MFTGIIETLGKITDLRQEQGNLHITVESAISNELKIDQSVAHNGVCLTGVAVADGKHNVTAIEETLNTTSLGHVDQTAICTHFKELNGSWEYTFEYGTQQGNVTVEKGSICVIGISLTVVNSQANSFSVAIIPYTFEHTNLHNVREGSTVNLEFDIIGKYVARLMQR